MNGEHDIHGATPENPNAAEAGSPDHFEFRVAHSAAGRRIDVLLAQRFPQWSRAFIQRCIRAGTVTINGRPCRPADRVQTNDLVSFTPLPQTLPTLEAEAIPLDVLYEDDSILVINKPPGLVVHPARGHTSGTLVHGLLGYDAERFQAMTDDEMRPGIVHRLDRDTSGAMVVARTEQARFALRRAFSERQVEKTYLALALGRFDVKSGTIRAPIGRHPRNRLKMAVRPEGRPAVSHYRVIAASAEPEITLVEVRIETGRTHQIRVHLAHIGRPVLGDPMYGGRPKDLETAPPARQMLHAWKLAFPHPDTGRFVEFTAPIPDDMREMLHQLGLSPQGSGRR